MSRFYRVYLRINSQEDNSQSSTIIDVVKSRHPYFVVEGVLDGYWRGFPEDTLVITITDDEEAVADTVQVVKDELETDFVAVVDQGDVTIM